MDSFSLWFIYVCIDGIIATAIGGMMSGKGYDFGPWFFYALLIWPVALIHGSMKPQIVAPVPVGELRKCPECAEMIRKEARKCRFCGSVVAPLAV
jgi:hypothetical protein